MWTTRAPPEGARQRRPRIAGEVLSSYTRRVNLHGGAPQPPARVIGPCLKPEIEEEKHALASLALHAMVVQGVEQQRRGHASYAVALGRGRADFGVTL